MSVDFKIGADPELFVRDRDGNLVSAYGMIPGTKYEPFKVEGGAVQVDGMALEFNIDPASNFKEFDKNITNVLRQLKEMIPAGYEFDFSPVAQFGKDYIQNQPEEARELGCDPDFDAYTGKPNPKPNSDYPFRTASGHIHIGWTEGQDIDVPEHIEACQMAVMQLDATIGLMCRKWDHDTIRSSMYGKFGAYRPKHYGVEYRTLSNTWVDDEARRKIVYYTTTEAMKKLLNGKRIYDNYYIPDFNRSVEDGDWSGISYHARRVIDRYLSVSIQRMYLELNSSEDKKLDEWKKIVLDYQAGNNNINIQAVVGNMAQVVLAGGAVQEVIIDDFEPFPNEFEEPDVEDDF